MSPSNCSSSDIYGYVRSYVADNSLLDGLSRVGLAVSGGSDSIALLHLFSRICADLGIVSVVLTYDHAIPGEHSDEDVIFVRHEAARLGLEFHSEVGRNIVARDGKSLEMIAREARHAFFRRMAREHALGAIATGHQANDVAETLLMRLLRGAGATGLSGMRPMSLQPAADGATPIRIIRPFLGVERDALRTWLRERNLSWREDPSNANEAITRNRVRRTVLPAIATGCGGIHDTVRQLSRSAEILRQEDEYLDSLSDAWLAENVSDASALPLDRMKSELPLPLSRRAIRKWMFAHCGAEVAGFSEVERVLAMSDGQVTTLAGGKRLLNDGHLLRVLHGKEAASLLLESELPVPGMCEWGGYVISTDYVDAISRSRQSIGAWPAECTISERALNGRGLLVRSRRDGDRMAPWGMRGTRKVQDIFTDAKLPRCVRDGYPIVCSGEEIAWIPGYRIASGFAAIAEERMIRIVIVPRGDR